MEPWSEVILSSLFTGILLVFVGLVKLVEIMKFTKRQKDYIASLIEEEVSFFNGWSVTKETQREACEKAAERVLRYIKPKLREKRKAR